MTVGPPLPWYSRNSLWPPISTRPAKSPCAAVGERGGDTDGVGELSCAHADAVSATAVAVSSG